MVGGDARDVFITTPYRVVDLKDEASVAAATQWWEEMTARGGEGMVVKPFNFITQGKRGPVQPRHQVPRQVDVISTRTVAETRTLIRLRLPSQCATACIGADIDIS